MLTKTEIRIHFFLIMASVLLFAIGFIEFQKFIGIETNLGRTVGMFFAGYAWFFSHDPVMDCVSATIAAYAKAGCGLFGATQVWRRGRLGVFHHIDRYRYH